MSDGWQRSVCLHRPLDKGGGYRFVCDKVVTLHPIHKGQPHSPGYRFTPPEGVPVAVGWRVVCCGTVYTVVAVEAGEATCSRRAG